MHETLINKLIFINLQHMILAYRQGRKSQEYDKGYFNVLK